MFRATLLFANLDCHDKKKKYMELISMMKYLDIKICFALLVDQGVDLFTKPFSID